MEFTEFRDLVRSCTIGKQLPDAVYVHESALGTIPQKLLTVALKIAKVLNIDESEWNIIKFNKRDFKVSFLCYPEFDTYSYPPLKHSYTVDLQKLSSRKGDYSTSDNPPILHRKETFVSENYPLIDTFKAITAEGESIGLYENTRSIGFKRNWESLINSKGYSLDLYGRLKAKNSANIIQTENTNVTIKGKVARHLTAIDRNRLSQPMNILARHNYLSGDYTVLDYGCGKGDDVRELEAHGIDVSGWDPAHNPEGLLINSDIVNLGFVLNVIEHREERDETLGRAWEYADRILIVSVMIAGESVISQFRPYKDGVLTSRNTFQRYYTQMEFRSYLESTLDDNVIAVGQGIFLIFKDKLEEQRFLLERQHIKRNWKQRTQREPDTTTTEVSAEKIQKNQSLFDDFWEATLDLGRIPANSEFEHTDQIRRICGSHAKAHQALLSIYNATLFQQAQESRKADLIEYFALGLFEKRKAYAKMPDGLKRDIKVFFGNHKEAIDASKSILFSVGNPALIEDKAVEAYEKFRSGEFNDGHSWVFHKDLLPELPVELRIYVGCATQLYGDLSELQLIKIHFTSGKVSLMGYDNWENDTPHLVERIKIKLREQDIDFFDYVGNYTPPPLLNKNLYLPH